MDKKLVKTRTLYRPLGFFDELKKQNLQQQKDKEKELKSKALQLRQLEISNYTTKCISAIEERCRLKLEEDGNNRSHTISGYIDRDGMFYDELPITDPQKIKANGYKDGQKDWVYPDFKPDENKLSCHVSHPYRKLALPYDDQTFVNGQINSLSNEISKMNPDFFSVTPIQTDNIQINRTVVNTPLNWHNRMAKFSTKVDGKCTMLKVSVTFSA